MRAGFRSLILGACLFASSAEAATFYARTAGAGAITTNWSQNTTWTADSDCNGAATAGIPGAADDVVMCNGKTVTVNATASVRSISMPATGATQTPLQITSAQVLSVSQGITVVSGTGNGGNRRILLSNGATLNVSGDVSLSGNNANDNRYALLDLDGVNVNIGGNLLIDGIAGNDRARVTLENSSNLAVGGSITLDLGGLLDNGNTQNSVVSVGGNFTHEGVANDYVSTGGEFRFTGTGAQALNGNTAITTTFYRLTINKASGDVTLNHNAQVANGGTLALTSGRVITGTSYVGLGTTAVATLSGGGATNYIAGNFSRYVPGGTQNVLFPVGGTGASKYAPVQIAFSNVTTAGVFLVGASAGNTDHPSIATSGLDPAASVNRYWTLTPGTVAFSGTTTTATFNYPSSDIDAGADTSAFLVGDYSAGAWSHPDVGTLGATSTQAAGLTTATIGGEFAIGEFLGPYSYWRMNETSWNGTANEVLDFGSASNPGTATTLSGGRPNTANTSPAIPGSIGTCRYGVFTRASKNYLALSTGYPGLMAAGQTGFSVTAWINSTNSTLPGQRIIIDDQNNTTPGGWGFSLGETDRAGAGGVRFYYRQGATLTLDTVPVPSNQWLFVALSVTLVTSPAPSTGTIYVYNTAGTLVTSYTQTFDWTPGSDAGPASIGGETNASGENTDQFGFSGNIDELRVYRSPLSQTLVNRVRQLTNPCDVTDHYALTGSTTGVTCDVSTVQVTAHNTAHGAVAPTAGTSLNLTTSTSLGVWQAGLVAGAGTWTPSGTNNGSGTYIWPGGESTFTVRLRHNTAATVNINLLDTSSKTESAAEDLAIVFADSAFRVTSDGTTAANVGTQLSAKNSNTGFGAQTLYLQAIRTDTNTGSCVGLFQNQTVTIEMAAARMNPTGSTSQVSVMNSSSAMVALGTGGGAAGTYGNVSLAFDGQSKAPLVVNYPNAGTVRLFARYQLPTPPTGVYASGTSNIFVVRPFGLRISGPPTGVTGAAGAVHVKAGATWPITVTAVQWASGEDADNDGVPDSDAILAGNAATTNFGAETTAATATITHTLAEPSGGNNGTLSAGLSAFASGVATSSATFSEVGIINLFASSTNYLASGQNVTNSSAGYTGVGRFYPDHFFVAASPASALTNRSALSCPTSPFTYLGENFGLAFTLQARNTASVITQNYTTASGFAKLVPASSAQLGLGARSGATNLTSRVTSISSAGTFTAGVSAITATATVNRNGTLTADGPFAATSVGVAPADSDGVTLLTSDMNVDVDSNAANDHQLVGAPTDFRFGRLRLQSANGSERLPLTMRVEAQYWNGNGFIINGNDSCTPLASNNVALGNYRGNLGSGETTATVLTAITSGVGTLRLSAPGNGNNGSVDLSINLTSGTAGASCIVGMAASTAGSKSWMQGAWCGTAADDDPSARATFGIYGASDRVIYLRENY